MRASKNKFSVKKLLQDSIKLLIDNSIVKVLLYIKLKTTRHDDVYKLIWERAAVTSADYIEDKLDKALLFQNRADLWDFTLSKIKAEGLFAEFGVFSGTSINYFAHNLKDKNITIYGFDSFEGLKEDWFGTFMPVGAFDLGGVLPKVLPNVTLIKGWFDSTLPKFLSEHTGGFSFVHLDADTYESTLLVLNLIRDRLAKDTVIIFDEYLGYPNWKNGEFLAWQNFSSAHNIRYTYLAFSKDYQAAIRLL